MAEGNYRKCCRIKTQFGWNSCKFQRGRKILCVMKKNCFLINQSFMKEILPLPQLWIQFTDASASMCDFHCTTKCVPQSSQSPVAKVWHRTGENSRLSYRYFVYTCLRKHICDLNIYEVLCWIGSWAHLNPVSVFWLHRALETAKKYLKGRDGIIWVAKNSDQITMLRD